MIDKRLKELKATSNDVNRNYILLSLSSQVDERLVDIYREILIDPDEQKYNKSQVIKNLSKYPDEVISKLLREAYAKNTDDNLKREIVNAISTVKPQLSIDFFIDNLGEANDNLRGSIWSAVLNNLTPDIANRLLSMLGNPDQPQKTESILRIFIEKGSPAIAGRVLDVVRIREQPAGILVLLFKLVQKHNPFPDEDEMLKTLTEIFFAAQAAPGHINAHPDIKEMEKVIQLLGGRTDKVEALANEAAISPSIEFVDTGDYFLLNGRKIFAQKAAMDALKILTERKGQYINNQKYAELIDPYGERNVGARALTTAISSLKSAIMKHYPEFVFDSLIGQKYGRGYYLLQNILIQ